MYTLGIETSCDETAAAVLCKDKIISNIISSQIKIHKTYGGVVPEFASRYHLDFIAKVVAKALEQAGRKTVDLIAVTRGPGLKGSLLIGTMFARSLGFSLKIPVIGINHLEGHLLAPLIGNPEITYPFVGLLVSGGHTSLFYVKKAGQYECWGQTIDDAVGEAYDKVSSILNLGYPGGPAIEKCARNGNPKAFNFPQPLLKKPSFDFSFSGLKTAVLYEAIGARDLKTVSSLKKLTSAQKQDIAASFQEAVSQVLVTKTIKAALSKKVSSLILSGGVARNQRLRTLLKEKAAASGLEVYIPKPVLCTDNAAMIAHAGFLKAQKQKDIKHWKIKTWTVDPNLKL